MGLMDKLKEMFLTAHVPEETRNLLEASPVKILPVLKPPWAAGAKPMTRSLPLRSPNPGTGLRQ